MNTKIDAQIWNSLSRVQKRAVAENMLVEENSHADKNEIIAWVGTLALSAAIVGFAIIAMR
jgi:hypothetical protein